MKFVGSLVNEISTSCLWSFRNGLLFIVIEICGIGPEQTVPIYITVISISYTRILLSLPYIRVQYNSLRYPHTYCATKLTKSEDNILTFILQLFLHYILDSTPDRIL